MAKFNQWMAAVYLGFGAFLALVYFLAGGTDTLVALAAAILATFGITTRIQNRADDLRAELTAKGLIDPERPNPVRAWAKRLYSRG